LVRRECATGLSDVAQFAVVVAVVVLFAVDWCYKIVAVAAVVDCIVRVAADVDVDATDAAELLVGFVVRDT
jgi:hypothetical protein